MSTDQSRDGWPIGAGAVLYRTETWHDDEPEMWWVIDVYDARSGSNTYVRLTCGTATYYEWMHIDDVRDLFVPAGWQADLKPTYTLTRQYGHEAYPRDRMAPEVYE